MFRGGCSREMGVKGSFLTKKNNVILPISYIFFNFWGWGLSESGPAYVE